MFERNKVDNIDHAVPVELVTLDGETLKGRLAMAQGRNVLEVLNGPGAFIDFEPWGGERTFLAKASIRNVCMVNVPRAQNLNQRLHDLDGFDPHAILGLVSTASFDDVKAAWHRLAKVYHPDRYSSAELPPEVRDYLANMARRVNAAYAALEAPMQATRRASHRAQPVYTSSPR